MALREVNLVPALVLHQRHAARRIRIWVGLLIALPGLIWGGYGLASAHTQAQQNHPHDLASLRREAGAMIAESARLQEQLLDARPLLDLLHRPSYAGYVTALSQALPSTIRITSVAFQTAPVAGAQGKLILTGQSSSHGELANFVERLDEHPMFERPAMTLTRAPSIPPPSARSQPERQAGFQLVCLVPWSPPAP